MLADFGCKVRCRTVDFTDLARCAVTYAAVTESPAGMNLDDILYARVLARTHNIMVDFGTICTDQMDNYKISCKEV